MAVYSNKIKKGILFALVCTLLQACASVPSSNSASAVSSHPVPDEQVIANPNETLLRAAENHTGLISFYKQRLEETVSSSDSFGSSASMEKSDQLRLKIAQSYLDSGDPESTLFYLKPVVAEGRGSAELFLLKSQAFLSMNNSPAALQAAVTAYGFNSENPEIYNQLGKIQASISEYDSARRNFEKARMGMLDDVTVQNNLAMVDILEGKYQEAVKRLMTLYTSGQVDDKVRANLALALAKSRRYQEFSSIFGSGKKEEDQIALFQVLARTAEKSAVEKQ